MITLLASHKFFILIVFSLLESGNFLFYFILIDLIQIIDVIHPGRPNVSKAELKEKLSRMYEVKDPNAIFVFKFRTHFGGGKFTGFGLIYDSVENAKKYDAKYRLIRDFIYWFCKVEKFLKCMEISEEKQAKYIARKLQGYAGQGRAGQGKALL
ncbi:40S ribosomal protein S24-2 [Camellia lanceoleosa]|uniref:40S ribosomal protein S24-2 n=1 Tax=Camellia lanceoleosa TaxID=1840588 RepID=A0ACC0G7M4_9ERIC|nr:40S ribosomal protein S24-2 [Camellia lanceoleosa]